MRFFGSSLLIYRKFFALAQLGLYFLITGGAKAEGFEVGTIPHSKFFFIKEIPLWLETSLKTMAREVSK